MNIDNIKNIETENDGKKIYLYRSTVGGQWVAYGLSAYALRLWTKAQSRDSLRSFAAELDMPCDGGTEG